MWILLRLILAFTGFAIRQLARGRAPRFEHSFNGTPYFQQVKHYKGSTKFTLGMQRKSPTWVRMHVESRADRFFKRLGIANEIETGDERFDDRVYVTCDHPHVATVLRHNAELRAAILRVFDADYRRIRFDGETVRIDFMGNREPTDDDVRLCKELWEASWRLEDHPPSRLKDPFLWKALVVEGVIWSLAGYAIGAGVQLLWHNEDVHVSTWPLVTRGLVVAAIAFVALLVVIVFWMRGSSRGHRVIVESAIVLLFGLPIASAQVVSDTNRGLDDAAVTTVVRTVDRCEVHKGRKKRTSYHLWTQGSATAIEVTAALCRAAARAGTVEIDIAPGFWGIPWYREMRAGGEVWSSPE